MAIEINIKNLLEKNIVESNRIEFKKGWNPASIYRAICAFANDFDNVGGGYIVIGVEEKDGVVQRPVLGLQTEHLDKIQREMIGFNNLLQPTYFPKISIEEVDDKQIIVLWIPGGASRPYKVPEDVTLNHKNCKYSNKILTF